MSLHFVSVLAIAGMSCLACIAQAAEPLRLDAAIERALATNPALVAQGAQLRAVEARAELESLPPPLVLGAQLENAVGTGALSGLDGAEATLQLERTVELGGKRAARQALGHARVASQRHAVATARLDVRARTVERFIEVAVDQRRLQDAQALLEAAQALRDEVARWVEAARNPESDLHAAGIAVAEAELQFEHAEHELEAARVALAATWGEREADFESVRLDLNALPELPDFDTLAAALRDTPAQQALLLEADAAAARRRLAVASGKPDLTLGLGVRRVEAIDEQALVMTLSMPLGSRRRAAPAIAEAEAQRAALDASGEGARIEAHQALFNMYQELQHARSEAEALRDRLLPQAEAAQAFAQRAFEAGRFGYQALAQATHTVIELRSRRTEALARYHLRRVELERFTARIEESLP